MQAPKLTFNYDEWYLHLTAESQSQGWGETTVGNALILVHTYGHTVALHCAGFDKGSQVVATYTVEPPDPYVTTATSKIGIDEDEFAEIPKAFNDAINQVFALMQHYYPD